MMSGRDDARRVITEGVANRIFPCAVAEVGDSTSTRWTQVAGTLTFESAAPAALDTPFDLASLTKVIATTTVVMRLVDSGGLSLDTPVAELFSDWRGADREAVVVRDLLEHASGLPARLVDRPPAGRREFEHEIGTMPLEYEPRTRSIYSDLGFILLGFAVADRGQNTLAALFRPAWADGWLAFDLPAAIKERAAPTLPMEGDARRGRMLRGEVHDDYAAALGGAAGHAGLFGTAAAVGAFARAVLKSIRHGAGAPVPFPLMKAFTRRSSVPGSSRALGWDTMLTSSSCGSRMSASAVGHVGFTGTSLWVDPERDRYFVLLTNRVCGGGTIDDMRTVRRAFHDALGDE